MNPDVRFTLGGILGGALLSSVLWGSMLLQAILYIKQYPDDPKHLKALVSLVGVIDTTQTGCIIALSYQYLILNFGSPEINDHIFPTVLASILFTVSLTFIVNSFFTHKVYRLSGRNWWLTGLILFFLTARVALALVTVTKMSKLKSFSLYGKSFAPLLTTALALSALTDMIITGSLCYYLRRLNPELYRTKKMVAAIVNFADNNGVLTCIVTISTLTCWVVMPHDLVFLGILFTLGKCYSNSLFGTLNMRNYVKRTALSPGDTINIMTRSPRPLVSNQRSTTARVPARWDLYEEEQAKDANVEGVMPLEIKVDKIVHYD